MLKLKNKPILDDFQKYVKNMEKDRGFEDQNVLQKCLMMGEEIGELFKAVRKAEGIKIDNDSKVGKISHEMVDVFIFLCAIANRYDIDLESAFREKELINQKRTWQKA